MSIALISVSRIEQVVNATVFNDRIFPKNSNSVACGITDFAITDGDIVADRAAFPDDRGDDAGLASRVRSA